MPDMLLRGHLVPIQLNKLMSFTSIRIQISSPRQFRCGSLFFLSGTTAENSRQFSAIRSSMVGNQTGRRQTPGVYVGLVKVSRGIDGYSDAQINFTMNNETNLPNGKLQQTGNKLTAEPTNPNQSPDFSSLGNDVFQNAPRVREFESSDDESFRTWLKASTSNQSVPPSLLERLKNIPDK
jgi:hypothetical protein